MVVGRSVVLDMWSLGTDPHYQRIAIELAVSSPWLTWESHHCYMCHGASDKTRPMIAAVEEICKSRNSGARALRECIFDPVETLQFSASHSVSSQMNLLGNRTIAESKGVLVPSSRCRTLFYDLHPFCGVPTKITPTYYKMTFCEIRLVKGAKKGSKSLS